MDPGVEDIDLNDPDVQNAAVKIQAGFRGHKTRKEMATKKPENQTVQPAPAEKPAENEDVADIDLTDPDLADAAVKIQAGFRGHLARKNIKKTELEEEINEKMAQLNAAEDDELADIDLKDPELNKAATRIQATFRGHRIRKEKE